MRTNSAMANWVILRAVVVNVSFFSDKLLVRHEKWRVLYQLIARKETMEELLHEYDKCIFVDIQFFATL